MKSLSLGQVRVLRALESGPKPTSNVTADGYVAGTAVTALEKRGFAKRTGAKDPKASITAAGKKALAAANI